MTQYLLSVWHGDEFANLSDDEMQASIKAVDGFNAKLQANGQWVFAGGLVSPESATVVRPNGPNDVVVTDGPFAETKENIGGFWIITAADFDEALRLAKQGAVACRAAVEVRPFHDEPPTA